MSRLSRDAFKAAALVAASALSSPPARAGWASAAAGGDKPAVEYVDPAVVAAQADALRDAVADPSVSDIRVHEQAHGFFDRIPTLNVVRAVPTRRAERERVTGELGTIAGMQAAAEARIERWKKAHRDEPPPPELAGAVETAKAMKDGEKLDYAAGMPENQMGVFTYLTSRLDGLIRLNASLRELAAVIGPAFAYATVVHESTHARDRAAGKLSPDTEIDGEVSAFRAQYDWLMLMDPLGERVQVLRSTLRWKLRRKPDPLTDLAVKYLDHLVSVRETGGLERNLRELVKRLGYGDPSRKGRGADGAPSA